MSELFDSSAIEQLIRDVGADVVPVVIQAVLTDIDERGARIDAGLTNNNLDQVAREAHALKSATRSVGLLKLSDTYASLEDAARREDDAAVSVAAQELRLHTATSRKTLQDQLEA